MGGFRRFIQIVIALVAIVVIVGSISLFYPLPYVSPFVENYVLGNFYLSLVSSVVLFIIALLCVIAFFQGIFASSKLDDLVIETDFGELAISQDAVESTAIRSVRHIKSVKNVSAKAKFIKDPSQTRLRIKFDIDEAEDIIAMSKDIQTRIQKAVETTLGLPIKSIDVEINQLAHNEYNIADRESTNVSRVQ